MTIWFTSDTHAADRRIAIARGFIRSPEWKASYEEHRRLHADRSQASTTAFHDWLFSVPTDRKTVRVHDMEDAIIENFNKLIKPNDTLYILGDVSHGTADPGTQEHVRKFLRRFNTTHLRMIIGNHDLSFYDRKYDALYGGLFESIEPNGRIEIPFSSGVETVYLSHFPFREDLGRYDLGFAPNALPRDGHKLLFGHTHQAGKAGNHPDSLNIGLDAWDMQPVSMEQVIDWFDAHKETPPGQNN